MANEFYVGARFFGDRGGLVDTKALDRQIARTNQKFAKRIKRSFEQSVATWDHPPDFHQQTSTKDREVEVFTYDFIYFLLDGGTAVRYMHMSKNFVSKTRPGTLQSRPGAGGPAYLDVDDPLPGIEARKFAEQVSDLHKADYEQAIQDDIDQAARTST